MHKNRLLNLVFARGKKQQERPGNYLCAFSTATVFVIATHMVCGATLVNLDATSQPLGPLNPWPNTGTLAGDFTPLMDVPEVIEVDGVKGVAFQGGTTGPFGTSYAGPEAPSSITGGSSRTMEAWIWDPLLQDEKTVVSWGHRGGNPDGSNSTFGHGVHPVWGGLGGWGYADMGYSNAVVAQKWTYIAYTYDSATRTARLYKDGVLSSTESYPNQPLVTFATDGSGFGIPIRVARQTEATGGASDAGVGTNVIAKVRVHDTARSEAQIQAQFESEKAQFGLNDSDGDGMEDWFETRYGLNNASNDSAGDLDSDGSSNLAEFQRGTIPDNPDTDGDGAKDGVETGTGLWVSATDAGTDPFDPDTDNDGLSDGAENNTGVFVSATNTGSNPHKTDTDNDTWDDAGEVRLGSDPNKADSTPTASSWEAAVAASNPKYWFRFEEADPSQPATNSGSATGFQGAYGPGIVTANLGRPSALPSLGKAIEFTGPAAANTTDKYVDMAAMVPSEVTEPNIPELVNLRPPTSNKVTTVEYWFKTTQRGTHGNNSWQSPSIIARESPGDGDMYWGKINDQGEFGFSTSDLNDILTRRNMNKNVTDGQWHHIVMIKEWNVTQPSRSTMYIDGGPLQPGGASASVTTAAGNASYQDTDALIRYIGFTQNGEMENVQYIGFLDEVVIYDRALSDTEVRLHSKAVLEADTDSDGMSDVYELNNQLDPNNPADAQGDADSDGVSNLAESQAGTNPQNADSDGDGLNDGAETNTRTWVSASNTGTDPLDTDTDSDGLLDGVENNSNTYVNPTQTGTSPLKQDSDNDGFSDRDEIILGTNPTLTTSLPTVPASWEAAVQADNPVHWLRFEETTTSGGIANLGSEGANFFPSFGPGMTDTDLGKASAYTNLGKAIEFTGPAVGNTTTKYIDFGAPIPQLVNLRSAPEDDKATTVEYWIRTTHLGSNGNNNWQNPSVFARESGGDGDMFWGNVNASGDFIFSTSDLHDAHITNRYVTDGEWHHVVLTKIWYTNAPSISRVYVDGGALFGGRTIETTTPGGNPSQQDDDGVIQYLGFTQSGELANVQFIGQIDEVAIYSKPFVEANARLHYIAGGGTAPAAPVSLMVERSGSNIILTWPTGTLLWSGEANGTYTPVANATSPYTTGTSESRKFYKVLVQ